MSTFHHAFLLVALAAWAPAQSNDFVGIMVRADGVTPPVNSVASYPPCGSPFSCTPLTLNATGGDTVRFFAMSTFNGLVVLGGTFTNNPLCLSLGIPGLANDLILTPGAIVTIWVGVATVPDNGRCNGGATPLTSLFQIPVGIPSGSLLIQAAGEAPAVGGGTGLAFSRAVMLSF